MEFAYGKLQGNLLRKLPQQATGNRQQATGNRQQATGNRQQATGNRQQATGLWGRSSLCQAPNSDFLPFLSIYINPAQRTGARTLSPQNTQRLPNKGTALGSNKYGFSPSFEGLKYAALFGSRPCPYGRGNLWFSVISFRLPVVQFDMSIQTMTAFDNLIYRTRNRQLTTDDRNKEIAMKGNTKMRSGLLLTICSVLMMAALVLGACSALSRWGGRKDKNSGREC
jgi:hypothetical protein